MTPDGIPQARDPRILIVKMWALGDVLQATPLLRALKRSYPACHITWIVRDNCAEILAGNPLVDEVIAFDTTSWLRLFRNGRIISYLRASMDVRRDLRARRFDIAIALAGEKWWSAWFVIGAPTRIGLFPNEAWSMATHLYTSVRKRVLRPAVHNSLHYLAATKALGIEPPYDLRMVFQVSAAHRAAANEFLGGHLSFESGRQTVILHPGTSQQTKCWLPEQYASVALSLKECNVVISGSPNEQELCDRIAVLSGSTPIVAAGRLRHVGELGALIERADAIVTGDTSAMHIASALETPQVAIFGGTRPADNTPLFGRSELLYAASVPCAPCYLPRCPLRGSEHMRCMRAVTPEEVLASLKRLDVSAEDGTSATGGT